MPSSSTYLFSPFFRAVRAAGILRGFRYAVQERDRLMDGWLAGGACLHRDSLQVGDGKSGNAYAPEQRGVAGAPGILHHPR